jgi:hypothetical protein
MTQLGVRRFRRLSMRSEQALDPNNRAPAQIDLSPRTAFVNPAAPQGQRMNKSLVRKDFRKEAGVVHAVLHLPSEAVF